MSDYSKYRIPELRQLIRDRDLHFHGATRKDDLIHILTQDDLRRREGQALKKRSTSPAKKAPQRSTSPPKKTPPSSFKFLAPATEEVPVRKTISPPRKEPLPARKTISPPRKEPFPTRKTISSYAEETPVINILRPIRNRQFKLRPHAPMLMVDTKYINSLPKSNMYKFYDILSNHLYTQYATLIDYILQTPEADFYPNTLLKKIGFPDMTDLLPYEGQLQLLWLFYATDMPAKVDEIQAAKLSELSYEELQNFLSQEGLLYQGTPDKASILFTAITGFKLISYPYNIIQKYYSRYAEFSSLVASHPYNVSFLNTALYQMTANILPETNPVRYIAFRDHPLLLEDFIVTTEGQINEQFDKIAQEIGMLQSPNNPENAYYYFYDNFKYYERVITRNPNIQSPPDLTNIPSEQRFNVITEYKDIELVEAYEIGLWLSRPNLINEILTQYNTPIWSFRNHYCNNAERINILTGEKRQKEDKNDPILSYGIPRNYRCFQASELLASFDAVGQGFEFRNPDWRKGDNFERIFPPSSIKQLEGLIANSKVQVLVDLYVKINQGLNIMYNIDKKINGLKSDYNSFPATQKSLIISYLVWVFLTAMYMRYWQGPGTEFPRWWIIDTAPKSEQENALRDFKVREQFEHKNRIIEKMTPETISWINNLPEIRYNFKYGTINLEDRKIEDIINKAEACHEKSCLLTDSYPMVETSYYLVTKLLSYNNDQFNDLLKHQLGISHQPPFVPK